MERVRCITEDNINLIGFLYDCNSDNKCWNLIFPGVDGNIITNEFIDEIGRLLSKNKYKFLCCHHRGSFQIYSSNPINPNIRGKTIGSVFEKFDDCFYDIDAWLKYSIENGANKINIMAHSHGCNKLIYYLSHNSVYDKYINKIILLSPLDLRTRMNNRKELNELYKKASLAKEKNDQDSFICCGFFYKNWSSFYDMMENKNIDNFPMMSINNNNFDMFNEIKKDKYIIYGEDEIKYITNLKYKKQFLDKNLKEIKIISSASHIYQGKEKVLAEYILDRIRRKE